MRCFIAQLLTLILMGLPYPFLAQVQIPDSTSPNKQYAVVIKTDKDQANWRHKGGDFVSPVMWIEDTKTHQRLCSFKSERSDCPTLIRWAVIPLRWITLGSISVFYESNRSNQKGDSSCLTSGQGSCGQRLGILCNERLIGNSYDEIGKLLRLEASRRRYVQQSLTNPRKSLQPEEIPVKHQVKMWRRLLALLAPIQTEIRKNPVLWQRVGRTTVVVVLAVFMTWMLYWYYMMSPWTRDGRVRAEVVDVATEISGKVVELRVNDNQIVHKGDVLFIIDPADYRLALRQAEATVQSRDLAMKIQAEESARRKALGSQAVSAEEIHTSENSAASALAAYEQAVAQRDLAKLNLDRTTITSPVNGIVTNLHLRVGDYATLGVTKLSVLDTDSYWVAGYFEETKLPRIHEGDFVRVKLMGVGPEIEGHVESISPGIADSNGGGAGTGLANVDPIFTWVRLAQRIPVRIRMDRVPAGVKIVAGQTCTVVVDPAKRP